MPKPPSLPPASSPSSPPLSRSGRRRFFPAAYKLHILQQAKDLGRGELGAFLRREGLYRTHLFKWRKELQQRGELGLQPSPRGPAPLLDDKDLRIAALEAQLRKTQNETELLRQLVALQKKVSEVLGVDLAPPEKP